MTLKGLVASWGPCPRMMWGVCVGLNGCEPPGLRGGFGMSSWGFKVEAEKAPWRAAWQDVTPGTRPFVLDRRLLLPTCQVPHAAPLSPPHGEAPKRLCGASGEGCGTAPCPPHHQGTVKVLKIPPRCLNSCWEHSRRRRRAGGLPLAGICHAEESTASSSWEIQAQDRPELPPVSKSGSLRTGGDPTSCDTPGIPCSAHNKHYK